MHWGHIQQRRFLHSPSLVLPSIIYALRLMRVPRRKISRFSSTRIFLLNVFKNVECIYFKNKFRNKIRGIFIFQSNLIKNRHSSILQFFFKYCPFFLLLILFSLSHILAVHHSFYLKKMNNLFIWILIKINEVWWDMGPKLYLTMLVSSRKIKAMLMFSVIISHK